MVASSSCRPRAGSGLPDDAHPDGKRPLHVPRGLPDAVGSHPDHGDGEDVAEPVRAARFAGARPGASRRVGRQGHGALRARWRADGGHREPAGGREDAEGDPVVHQRADQGAGQHAHSQRPYRRQRLLREAGRADLRAGEPAQRDAAAAAARQRPARSGARHWPAFQSRPTTTTPPRRAAGGHLQHERRNGGLHSDDAVPHRRRHHRALPQGQRDLHRGFLPQLRLSLRRSGQRRFDQRACSMRSI